jgi:hypothetical protein
VPQPPYDRHACRRGQRYCSTTPAMIPVVSALAQDTAHLTAITYPTGACVFTATRVSRSPAVVCVRGVSGVVRGGGSEVANCAGP